MGQIPGSIGRILLCSQTWLGTLPLYEYGHSNLGSAPLDLKELMKQINESASIPANVRFDNGILEKITTEVGFVKVVVKDLTINATSMLRAILRTCLYPVADSQVLGTASLVRGYRCRC